MAKRINKKVAIIGSIFLAVMILAGIFVMLKLFKDPQKLIEDAQAAIAEGDYENAQRYYGEAFGATKDRNLKIKILFDLANLHKSYNEWPKAAGCWDKIVTTDPDNFEARNQLLNYFYEMADSGAWDLWSRVRENAAQIIDANLDSSGETELKLGRSIYEMTRLGIVTDKSKEIELALNSLRKVYKLKPADVNVAKYLADAIYLQGQIKEQLGQAGSLDPAAKAAEKILADTAAAAADNPQAHINLLAFETTQAAADQEKRKTVEQKFISLSKKFPDSPDVFATLARFYSLGSAESLPAAIEAIETAIKLDPNNVHNHITAATLNYSNYSFRKQPQSLNKAMQIAQAALLMPDANAVQGSPRYRTKLLNKLWLEQFLANLCLEESYKARMKSDTAAMDSWNSQAQQHIASIIDTIGSGETNFAVMWDGRLKYAREQSDESIRQMYSAYEQLMAGRKEKAEADIALAQLSYTLARAINNTAEIGQRMVFLRTAIENGIQSTNPEVILDFAEGLIQYREYNNALTAVDNYQNNIEKNTRTIALKAQAQIGLKMFDDADKTIAELKETDPETIKLKYLLTSATINNIRTAWSQQKMQQLQQSQPQEQDTAILEELSGFYEKQAALVRQMLGIDPNSVEDTAVIEIAQYYSRTGAKTKATGLIDDYLKIKPQAYTAKVYKVVLNSPDPNSIDQKKLNEITEKVLLDMPASTLRDLAIGAFYANTQQKDKACEYFESVLADEPNNMQAFTSLFDIYISQEKFDAAAKMVENARKMNLDRCNGEVFEARLSMAKKEYDKAKIHLDRCIETRPIFSQAYLMRSQVHSDMGNESDAITDALKAVQMNPLDPAVAAHHAILLYNRNMKLGTNVSADQVTEVKMALQRAIAINPANLQLQSIYAEHLSETSPDEALAIRQRMQAIMPNVENSVMLGNMAMRIASRQNSQEKQKAYIQIAGDAFKKAFETDPSSNLAKNAYAEFLRVTGETEKAAEMLEKDPASLWKLQFRDGKFEQAKATLEQLYKDNPKEPDTLIGLINVSRKTNDIPGINKYSNELIAVSDTPENRIIQIEALLDAGNISDAEKKLAGFREKHPDNASAIWLDAWLSARKGLMDRAIELVNKNLELQPDNPRTWRLRGQINAAMGNHNAALDDFLKSKNMDENPEIRMDLAKIYMRLERPADAIIEMKVAIRDPAAPITASLLLEEIYKTTNRQKDLTDFYNEMAAAANGADVFWNIRHAGYEYGNKNYTAAAELFLKAWDSSQTSGGSGDALDGYLLSLVELKEYDKLQQFAAKQLDGKFAPLAYAALGLAKHRQNDDQAATELYDKALQKSQDNENLLLSIIQRMYNDLGADKVLAWCTQQLNANPDSEVLNLAAYNMYQFSEQYNKALQAIDKCISLSKDQNQKLNYQISKAATYYSTYIKSSDKTYLSKALDEYKTVLDRQPQNVTVLNNLSYLLCETDGDLQQAFDYAQRAQRLLPNNPNIMDTMAYVLIKQKEYAKAEQLLISAVGLFEQSSLNAPLEVYEHLGMAKENLGKKSEAIESYRTAMKQADKNTKEQVKQRIQQNIDRLSADK